VAFVLGAAVQSIDSGIGIDIFSVIR
jgi:hypothetical protein